jgi:hypothetical protein
MFTGIAGAHDHEAAEHHEEPADIEEQFLGERQRQLVRERRRRDLRDDDAGDPGDERLDGEARAAREALVGLLRDLEVVVVEADGAEAHGHQDDGPHIGVGEVRPQKGRDQHARDDHEPAHGGRAALRQQMRLRAVLADRLPLALLEAEQRDDRRSEPEHEQNGRRRGAARPKRDVTEDVERTQNLAEIG